MTKPGGNAVERNLTKKQFTDKLLLLFMHYSTGLLVKVLIECVRIREGNNRGTWDTCLFSTRNV